MTAATALLRRLRSQWACAAIGGSTWVPYAAAARHATAGKSGGDRRRGKSSGKVGTARKVRKEASEAADTVVGGAAAAAVAEAPAQQQRPENSATRLLQSPLWSPTEAEYEALVANLLLYRRESLEPVLSALQKERALFEESVKQMETRVAELYAVREEIRKMLQDGAAAQRRALAEALPGDHAAADGSAEAEAEAEAEKTGRYRFERWRSRRRWARGVLRRRSLTQQQSSAEAQCCCPVNGVTFFFFIVVVVVAFF
ncbi:subtilisin-like serine peptidase [Trypanosoma conorhini]|uniref:Subtilisin-like serine peptidase n=1 Tax=Trypanosoma conorhini TaxID=83891 RepID=A0A422PCT4_9TRYP|nr:subtilisin-like serine peptidase [Trypanosoma conorhini]RNF15529.1 subtilisin-like serine peptidase [Trypanosoma conorhini]